MASIRIIQACTEFGLTLSAGQIDPPGLSPLQQYVLALSGLAELQRGAQVPQALPTDGVVPITTAMLANPAAYGLNVTSARTYEVGGLRYYWSAVDGKLVTAGGLTQAQAGKLKGALGSYGNSYTPVRGVTPAALIQFRGPTDTAASLGVLGGVVNAESLSSAGSRLQAGACEFISKVNGASAMGANDSTDLAPAAITTFYLGVIGRTAPYTVQDTGPVLAATPGMARLTWDAALNVRSVLIVELPPENYAGTPGTGSARQVLVMGLAPDA